MMCAFQIIVLKREVKEAWKLFNNVYFPEYRDASIDTCTYLCSIIHCLKGLSRAISLDWFNFNTFDVQSYDYYDNLINGDLNWIIPNKLLAFSNPNNGSIENYAKTMKNLKISAIIRLNL